MRSELEVEQVEAGGVVEGIASHFGVGRKCLYAS